MDSSGIFQQRNRASVEATFVISLRIAKAKKPHTIAEQLILPCAKDINWKGSREQVECTISLG